MCHLCRRVARQLCRSALAACLLGLLLVPGITRIASVSASNPVSAIGSGVAPWQLFTTIGLGAGISLRANDVNGNLLIDVAGLALPGVNGFAEAVTLHYNSLSYNIAGSAGNGWLLGTGQDIRLVVGPSSATFYDETGRRYVFSEPSSCSFTPPAGIDAALICSGSNYVLTKNVTQEQYQFNSTGYLTALQNRQGNRITFTYNTAGTLVTQITNTEGQVTTLGYGGSGLLASITDAASRTWQYAHDASGNLTQITDPAGHLTKFTYSGSGNLTKVTDPRGTATLISYNASSAVTQIIRNTSGPTWAFGYSSGSTQVTDPNSHTTTYGYDSSGRVTSVTDPDSHATQATWTADNHVATIVLPSTATFTFSYDSLNNLTQLSLPTGAHLNWQYLSATFPYNPTSFTDAQGNTTQYTAYNGQGLLQDVSDATGIVTMASYNGNGTMANFFDPNGHTTSYSYNSSALLSGITYPTPLGARSFTYNARDRLASATDGKNQTTTYQYDPIDEPITITYADASQIVYGYDANGNRTSLTDSTGTITYIYNRLNQVTQETLPNGHTISYTWDGVNNLLTKTDGGGTVTYTYTPENRVASVTDPQNAQTTLSYDQDGNRTQAAYPNGDTVAMSYNSSAQLTLIKATKGATTLTSSSYSYTNPANGQATGLRYSVTDAANNVTSYTYDKLNRLTQAVQTNGGTQLASYAYGFDAAGNITSQTINGTNTTLSYNGANELSQAGSTTYSYDADGNATGNSTGLSLVYNAQNQTTSITPPGGSAISYAYSDQGQAQRVTAGSASYQFDITELSAQTVSASTTYFTLLPNGALLSERRPTGTYYYLADGLDSVVAVANSAGSVVNSYSYDPFGNAVSTTEAVANPFRFQGAQFDAATGFYKMGARYYVPGLGRWTQADASFVGYLNNPQTLDLYAFVTDCPINFTDPTGEVFNPAGVGASCVAGGLGLAATTGVIGVVLGPLDAASIAAGFAGGCVGGSVTYVASSLLGLDP